MTGSTYVLAIDQGTTSTRAILFDASGKIRVDCAGRIDPALPKTGLGRARSRRDVACRGNHRPRGYGRGGRTDRCDRYRQSARDDHRLGTGDRPATLQRDCLAGPAYHPNLCRLAAGWAWRDRATPHRPRHRPLFLGFQDPLAARPCPRPAPPRRGRRDCFRHDRQLSAVAADLRQTSRDRRHQRGAHDAVRYPAVRLGSRNCSTRSRSHARSCRRCSTPAPISG